MKLDLHSVTDLCKEIDVTYPTITYWILKKRIVAPTVEVSGKQFYTGEQVKLFKEKLRNVNGRFMSLGREPIGDIVINITEA